MHGLPVQLDIDKLWIKNINVTTGLVSGNTTEELLEALKSKIIQPEQLVTHYSKLSEIESAYDLFRNATDHKAVSYTHLTLPTKSDECRSRWSTYN